jgi:hypothetical protein
VELVSKVYKELRGLQVVKDSKARKEPRVVLVKRVQQDLLVTKVKKVK